MGYNTADLETKLQLEERIAQLYKAMHAVLLQMSSERQCGLGSLLPMSCRGRAEAFARRLHTRLRRLGAEPRAEPAWPAPGALSRHDSDAYFDFGADQDSPSSPAEEVTEGELAALVNSIALADPESGCVLSSPADVDSHSNSDSDATYYDLDTDQDSPAKLTTHRKTKSFEDAQIAKNLANSAKLKLASPELREQLIQYKPPSPERQSPVKTLPLTRENGYVLERRESQNSLYSPIRFDDCQKRNSLEKEVVNGEKKDEAVSTVSKENGSQSPKDYDEPDFCKPNFLTNGTHDIGLHEDVINDCVEAELPINGADDGIVKEIHVDIICDKEAFSNDCELETAEEVAASEREGKPAQLLEKLDFSKISDNAQAAEEDDTQDSNSNEDLADNDAEGDDRPQRVRRCSSLRSGKTPPGTPGRKKIVRFADVLGLDLADVKTFMDDIPYIPRSAFEDLRDADLHASSTESFSSADITSGIPEKRMICMFSQPGDQPNFLDILNTRSACLENAYAQEGGTSAICGTVRVRNLDFHKSVQIRYSIDSWKTFSDLQATYVPNSCDGFSDRFQFILYAHTLMVGQRLEFAVRFMCKGCQFWDNNLGANYCFQCVSYASSANFFPPTTTAPVDAWQGSFY